MPVGKRQINDLHELAMQKTALEAVLNAPGMLAEDHKRCLLAMKDSIDERILAVSTAIFVLGRLGRARKGPLLGVSHASQRKGTRAKHMHGCFTHLL